MDKRIACIVVTYNRKELLFNCIQHICNQSYRPETIYVIDNASTDGTLEMADKMKKIAQGLNFKYVRLEKNLGGAGGFYTGLKMAHESGKFDAYWVMDDDGIPEKNCLKQLLQYYPQYDFLSPMVLSVDDHSKLAFNYHGRFESDELIATFGNVVPEYSCPFNGILLSRKLVDKIGYPIPQLFIWGDERNYTLRAKDSGAVIVTITSAIHYHPSDKMTFSRTLFNKSIVTVPNKWKGYCYWRNTVFNGKGRMSLKNYFSFYVYNAYYYLFIAKDWGWFRCFNEAFFSGFKKCTDEGFRKYIP